MYLGASVIWPDKRGGLVRGGLLYIFFFLLLLYGMTLTKYMIRVAMDNIYWMGCIQSNRNVNHLSILYIEIIVNELVKGPSCSTNYFICKSHKYDITNGIGNKILSRP
jgi:hypothetical protein